MKDSRLTSTRYRPDRDAAADLGRVHHHHRGLPVRHRGSWLGSRGGVAGGGARAGGRYGGYGTVWSVTTVSAPQAMWNLSIAGAHTFFVGGGQWLVHNARCSPAHIAMQHLIASVLEKAGIVTKLDYYIPIPKRVKLWRFADVAAFNASGKYDTFLPFDKFIANPMSTRSRAHR